MSVKEVIQNIALGIEYDGQNYYGWQRQKHCCSVQGELENALSSIANQNIEVNCAGRTDTGVHATGQVVNFEYQSSDKDNRKLKAWIEGTNARLPDDISVKWAVYVAPEFHARFKAYSRSYRYLILNHRARSGLLNGRVSQFVRNIEIEKIERVTECFLGEQDFSTVRAANCQSKSCFRNITELSAKRLGDFIVIDISANAFLYHMVRNIVGILVAVGQGDLKPLAVRELLDKKDRTLAPATAPASGLYLTKVEYPSEYGIPDNMNEFLSSFPCPIG